MKNCVNCGKPLKLWEQFGASILEPLCWDCYNKSDDPKPNQSENFIQAIFDEKPNE